MQGIYLRIAGESKYDGFQLIYKKNENLNFKILYDTYRLKSFYEILGFSNGQAPTLFSKDIEDKLNICHQEIIKILSRTDIQNAHAVEVLKLLTRAYNTLTNPEEKQAYDLENGFLYQSMMTELHTNENQSGKVLMAPRFVSERIVQELFDLKNEREIEAYVKQHVAHLSACFGIFIKNANFSHKKETLFIGLKHFLLNGGRFNCSITIDNTNAVMANDIYHELVKFLCREVTDANKPECSDAELIRIILFSFIHDTHFRSSNVNRACSLLSTIISESFTTHRRQLSTFIVNNVIAEGDKTPTHYISALYNIAYSFLLNGEIKKCDFINQLILNNCAANYKPLRLSDVIDSLNVQPHVNFVSMQHIFSYVMSIAYSNTTNLLSLESIRFDVAAALFAAGYVLSGKQVIQILTAAVDDSAPGSVLKTLAISLVDRTYLLSIFYPNKVFVNFPALRMYFNQICRDTLLGNGDQHTPKAIYINIERMKMQNTSANNAPEIERVLANLPAIPVVDRYLGLTDQYHIAEFAAAHVAELASSFVDFVNNPSLNISDKCIHFKGLLLAGAKIDAEPYCYKDNANPDFNDHINMLIASIGNSNSYSIEDKVSVLLTRIHFREFLNKLENYTELFREVIEYLIFDRKEQLSNMLDWYISRAKMYYAESPELHLPEMPLVEVINECAYKHLVKGDIENGNFLLQVLSDHKCPVAVTVSYHLPLVETMSRYRGYARAAAATSNALATSAAAATSNSLAPNEVSNINTDSCIRFRN